VTLAGIRSAVAASAACVLVGFVDGCAREVASDGSLVVFAAASLTEAFTSLGQLMERRNPGLRVRFNFAGSQQLATQIEQGAQADVLASADTRWMDYVAQRMLVAGEAQPFVRNRLAVITPRANHAGIDSLAGLAVPGIKLVLAAADVPAGRYSRQVLEKLSSAPGFGSDFERRVLQNVVSEEENVKAVVSKVQLGEADAGIVYTSDVTPTVREHVRVIEIPNAYNVVASYPIAVLEEASNEEAARRFVELVLSDIGQRLLGEHGFVPVRAPPSARRGRQ
jgi:molybdate transport system substrate-binding protein